MANEPNQLPKDGYYTLDEACMFNLYAHSSPYIVMELPADNGFSILKNNPEIRTQVADHLSKLGFKRFNYFAHGSYAIVFKTTDNQLIRISSAESESKRINHPAILQPIASYHLGGLNIEILPQIRRTELDVEQQCQLVELFENAEYSLKDDYWHPNNSSLLADRKTPVFIDADVVNTSENADRQFDDPKYDPWMAHNKNGERKKNSRGNDVWKQKELYPNIGTGKFEGVVSNCKLKKLRENRGDDSLIVQALESGLYGEEVGGLIANPNGDETEVSAEEFSEKFQRRLQDHLSNNHGPEKLRLKKQSHNASTPLRAR